MSNDQNAQLLHDAIGPFLASDEASQFLEGQRLQDDVRAQLSESAPGAEQQFNQLLLKFMWEEIPIDQVQTQMNDLFMGQGQLRSMFSAFLEAPTSSHAEQVAAKAQLCRLTGLITQKRNPGGLSMEEATAFVKDVEERFKGHPGKYEEFLRISFTDWRNLEQGTDTNVRVVKSLEGEPDLIERYWALQRGSELSSK